MTDRERRFERLESASFAEEQSGSGWGVRALGFLLYKIQRRSYFCVGMLVVAVFSTASSPRQKDVVVLFCVQNSRPLKMLSAWLGGEGGRPHSFP